MIKVGQVVLIKQLSTREKDIFGVVVEERQGGFIVMYHDEYNAVTKYFYRSDLLRLVVNRAGFVIDWDRGESNG